MANNNLKIEQKSQLDQVDYSIDSTVHFKSQPTILKINDKYNREDERLKTFDNWPLSWLDKNKLAQTGMFYENLKDRVKCYFCQVEIGCWDREDQPEVEHLRFSPNCPLLRKRSTNNVPISQTPTTPSPSSDTLLYEWNHKYNREDERLKSFDNWPLDWLDKHQLAQTGLFYTKHKDIVRCFFCDVHMSHWKHKDQPIRDHLRCSPNCPLLRRRPTNNVPLNNDELERVLPIKSFDICGSPGGKS